MMSKNLAITGLLASALMLITDMAHSNTCIAAGDNRQHAARQFSQQCERQLADCDQHQQQWYCADQRIDSQSIERWLQNSQPAAGNAQPPVVDNSCIDTDGDGWGWNGTASCKVETSGTATTIRANNIAAQAPQGYCADPDGDGWGWDGVASCRVVTSTTSTTDHQQYRPLADTDCSGSYNPEDITDLVLATGQSNLTGADTTVSASNDRFGRVTDFHQPDKPHPRVFAWTVDSYNNNNGTGWKVANLTQSWHDSNPGVGGTARNNFAFHFAKQVAEQGGCRVVGIIIVSEGGRGISHWDYNAPGWNGVTRHVNEAISAIGRSTIDGILWHQGESDWIADGTCYTGSVCSNMRPDYYPQKLYSRIARADIPNTIGHNALIDRLRLQPWYSAETPFIAGETVRAPVNIHLNKLNSDNDKWTACVRGDAESGLGIRENDPHKNHYSAAGLREIGSRYAAAYLKMKQN